MPTEQEIPEYLSAKKESDYFAKWISKKESARCLQYICITALYLIMNHIFEKKEKLFVDNDGSKGKIVEFFKTKLFKEFCEENQESSSNQKKILENKFGYNLYLKYFLWTTVNMERRKELKALVAEEIISKKRPFPPLPLQTVKPIDHHVEPRIDERKYPELSVAAVYIKNYSDSLAHKMESIISELKHVTGKVKHIDSIRTVLDSLVQKTNSILEKLKMAEKNEELEIEKKNEVPEKGREDKIEEEKGEAVEKTNEQQTNSVSVSKKRDDRDDEKEESSKKQKI